MYINVGMANHEKRPKQERDDIRFTHIAIRTSFYNFLLFCTQVHGVCCECFESNLLHARWQSNAIFHFIIIEMLSIQEKVGLNVLDCLNDRHGFLSEREEYLMLPAVMM